VERLARRINTPTRLLSVLLASFGVVLGCAIAAGELLELAEGSGGSTAFDNSITSWVVDHRTRGLTILARVFSTIGSQTVLLPVVAVALVVLLWKRQLASAGVLAAAWAGAIGLYHLTKDFVNRPRPPSRIWLTDVGGSSSFPSGHATQSLATLLALALVSALWLPRMRWLAAGLAVVIAVGVGWSRVYLGVHWTTDVLAGWLIAAAWVAIIACLWGWHARSSGDGGRKAVEPRGG
jgi:undecaprenyl-diphosphatase